MSEPTKTVKLPLSLYRRFKQEAARRSCFLPQIFKEALKAYFERRGKHAPNKQMVP